MPCGIVGWQKRYGRKLRYFYQGAATLTAISLMWYGSYGKNERKESWSVWRAQCGAFGRAKMPQNLKENAKKRGGL